MKITVRRGKHSRIVRDERGWAVVRYDPASGVWRTRRRPRHWIVDDGVHQWVMATWADAIRLAGQMAICRHEEATGLPWTLGIRYPIPGLIAVNPSPRGQP